jgi:2-polyprenyl-3-methyl-5-hydroxy-6-metoxy-1,4-benzoquinol methylase
VEETVTFRSPRGRLTYRDSRDHFENGLLRLLRLDVDAFQAWLAAADQEGVGDQETDEDNDNDNDNDRRENDGAGGLDSDLLNALGHAFQRLRPLAPGLPLAGAPATVEPGPDGEIGSLWQPRIAESPAFGVARSLEGGVGWLVKSAAPGGWQREREPPGYEEAYFEGDPLQSGGYGDYAAQQGWRLEKARRQLRELSLDVGSGYGFFRKAAAETGMVADGLEISAHARAVASRLYGLETASGSLADHAADWQARYDLITLWDMLEHVAAPRAFLAQIASCLRPGGTLAIKTPNLDCPEAAIFGPHYHSLKREHLVYFTPSGIAGAARAAGLEPVHVSSTSHLLVGFVGRDQTQRWAADLRGADLTIYLRRPPGASAPLRDEVERV